MFLRVLIMPLDCLSCFAVVLRGILQKIHIFNELRIFPYSEVTHGSITFKLQKRQSTIEFDFFVLCFIFFIPVPQTICAINRNYMCYFLHASNEWCMCWCVHVRSHTSNEEDCHCFTKGEKCFNLF